MECNFLFFEGCVCKFAVVITKLWMKYQLGYLKKKLDSFIFSSSKLNRIMVQSL
jgi:hypothetical protein